MPSFRSGFGDPVLPQILVIWQAAAVLVLLIACVNVANLMLAQAAERGRELALRMALGAGPGRVARQLLTEGVIAARGRRGGARDAARGARRPRAAREHARGDRALRARLGPARRRLAQPALQRARGGLAAFVFSAVPAWRAARLDLNATLREGGRSVTGGGRRQLGRNLLVVGQLAAALALLVVAGDAGPQRPALARRPAGLRAQGCPGFRGDALGRALLRGRAAARLRARRAGAARRAAGRRRASPPPTRCPGRNGYSTRGVAIEGQPLAEGSDPPQVEARVVTPGLLRDAQAAARCRAAASRRRTPRTAARWPWSAGAFAERFWPGQDPIGKRFRVVSGDAGHPGSRSSACPGDVIHQWIMRRNEPTFYRPLVQAPAQRPGVRAARRAAIPRRSRASVRRALAAVDPDQPAYQLKSLPRSIRQSTIGLQFIAGIMVAFGVLALVLAVGGVYGVMSYRVSRRTLEIGVRVALGASRRDVLRLTLGQALRLAAVGLPLGAGLGWAASRALALGAARRGGVRAAGAGLGRAAAGHGRARRGLDPRPPRARGRPGPSAALRVAAGARGALSPPQARPPFRHPAPFARSPVGLSKPACPREACSARAEGLGWARPDHKEVPVETLVGLWLPILVSAVLVFVASSLIWNVLGAHKFHIRGLPDEAGAREALGKQALAAGQYSIPYCPDPAMMKDPAFKEKIEKGPVALLIVRNPGLPNMGEFLGAWFVYLLFVSYFVALRVRPDAAARHALHASLPRGGGRGVRRLLLRPDPERDLVGTALEERAQGGRGRHRLRAADRRDFRLALAAPLGRLAIACS